MALLLHDLKILYIIVPGTGSSSFHDGIRDRYKKWDYVHIEKDNPLFNQTQIKQRVHLPAKIIKQEVSPQIWMTYHKIAFVRNPFDWVNSIYNKGGIEVLGLNNKVSFSEFIENINLTPYYWFTDDNGSVMIDEVLRTEDLDTKLFKRWSIPESHKNPSRKPKNKFTAQDKEIIKEKFYRESKHYE